MAHWESRSQVAGPTEGQPSTAGAGAEALSQMAPVGHPETPGERTEKTLQGAETPNKDGQEPTTGFTGHQPPPGPIHAHMKRPGQRPLLQQMLAPTLSTEELSHRLSHTAPGSSLAETQGDGDVL